MTRRRPDWPAPDAPAVVMPAAADEEPPDVVRMMEWEREEEPLEQEDAIERAAFGHVEETWMSAPLAPTGHTTGHAAPALSLLEEADEYL